MFQLLKLEGLAPLQFACVACLAVAGGLSLVFGQRDRPEFYLGTRLARARDIGYRWVVVAFFAAVHLAVLAVIWELSSIVVRQQLWQLTGWVGGFIWAVGWYKITGLGLTGGFHRIATHSCAREVPPWLKWLLYSFGQAAGEQPVEVWVATHQFHHQHSDKPDDPHSPMWRRGQPITNRFMRWFHPHMGWIVEPLPATLGRRLAGDIAAIRRRDPVIAKASRWYEVCIFVPIALAWLIGGWPLVMWRLVGHCLTYHTTWLVNSAAHHDQLEPDRRETSRNLAGLWAWLTGGESLHRLHHDTPSAGAYVGRWLRHDWTGRFLLWLDRRGIIRQLKTTE